jgi:hypothetical protein
MEKRKFVASLIGCIVIESRKEKIEKGFANFLFSIFKFRLRHNDATMQQFSSIIINF